MSGWISRQSGKLAFVCNLLVIVIGVLAVVRYVADRRPPPDFSKLRVGRTFGPLPGGQPPRHAKNILIATSSHCAICSTEASEYRELEKTYMGRPDVSFAYLMPEDSAKGRAFLAAAKLRGAGYFKHDLLSAGISAIPVMLVVDGEGIIRFTQVGPLTAERRKELDAVISN